jgi:transposase-like protein
VNFVEASPLPPYQRIAAQARRLRRLGMSCTKIAATLGVTDKTVARSLAWDPDTE